MSFNFHQSSPVNPTVSSLPPDLDGEWIESEAQSQAGSTQAKTPRLEDLVTSYDALLSDHPQIRPEIIEGLLRRGEVMNVIAAPKTGKSWLVHALVIAAAEGGKWLGRQTFAEGKILLVDNELHRETLSQRLKKVRYALQADDSLVSQRLDVMPIRGESIGLGDLESLLSGVESGTYDLLVLDAFYRCIPKGVSENDNAGVMELYNQLDRIAAKQGCAIVVIHHASKGDQSSKSVTDVGAGAGSQSRAADTHLTIRPHEQPDMAVLDGVVRSNKPLESVTLEKHPDHEFPLWRVSDEEPVLKSSQPRAAKQEQADKEADSKVVEVLEASPGQKLKHRRLRELTGFGDTRLDRALIRLAEGGLIKERRVRAKTTGKPTRVILLVEKSSDGF